MKSTKWQKWVVGLNILDGPVKLVPVVAPVLWLLGCSLLDSGSFA